MKKGRPTNFGSIRAFFLSSYRVNVTSCNLCAKITREPFPGKIDRGILNLVALALTVTELFNKVCGKV